MSYTKKMTEGSELKHIILFTLPLFAGNVFQQLYNIVDSIIVGKYLGANKLAAVGTTGSLTYLFSTLCIGLSVGAGILISQRFGAGMHKEVRKLITNSAYVIIAFGAVITVISVAFAGLLMKMMNTPENLLEDATAYMRAACSGTICVAAYNWINSVMRSLGDSRTPLIFLVVASLLNVGLDLLFVCVFQFGVVGRGLRYRDIPGRERRGVDSGRIPQEPVLQAHPRGRQDRRRGMPPDNLDGHSDSAPERHDIRFNDIPTKDRERASAKQSWRRTPRQCASSSSCSSHLPP